MINCRVLSVPPAPLDLLEPREITESPDQMDYQATMVLLELM